MGKITIVNKGILDVCGVDAIVNPSNTMLMPGGGLNGLIHKAAGVNLSKFCEKLGHIKTGDAIVTPGFNIKAQIIHTAGPGYHEDFSEEKLIKAYRNILRTANNHGFKKISIPAISAGVYGFPADVSAKIAISTIKNFFTTESNCFEEIILTLFDKEIFSEYQKVLN